MADLTILMLQRYDAAALLMEKWGGVLVHVRAYLSYLSYIQEFQGLVSRRGYPRIWESRSEPTVLCRAILHVHMV